MEKNSNLTRAQLLSRISQLEKKIIDFPFSQYLRNVKEIIETLGKYEIILKDFSSEELTNFINEENKKDKKNNPLSITVSNDNKFYREITSLRVVVDLLKKLSDAQEARVELSNNLRNQPKILSFNTEEDSLLNHMRMFVERKESGFLRQPNLPDINNVDDFSHLGDKLTLKKFNQGGLVSLQKINEIAEFFESSPMAFINTSQLINFFKNYSGRVNGPSVRIDGGGHKKRIPINPFTLKKHTYDSKFFEQSFTKMSRNLASLHNVKTEQRWFFHKIDNLDNKKIEEDLSALSAEIQHVIDAQNIINHNQSNESVDFSLQSQLKGVKKNDFGRFNILETIFRLKSEGIFIGFGNYNHTKPADINIEYTRNFTLRKILLIIVSQSNLPKFVSVDGGQDFDYLLSDPQIYDNYSVNGTKFGFPEFYYKLNDKLPNLNEALKQESRVGSAHNTHPGSKGGRNDIEL